MGILEFVKSLFAGEDVGSNSLAPADGLPGKWLPSIDSESCTGCGLCLQVCDHGCLGMVWEFATLMLPEDCGGEGRCAEVCREEVIHMKWVTADVNPRGRRKERRDES